MVIASPSPVPAPALSASSRPACFSASSHSSSPRASKSVVPSWYASPRLVSCSPWSGLKHLGIALKPKPLTFDRRRRCRGMMVYASLFGVGAPEALVIGVVALLVFGPKGLAEVARNLGKTLRAFQPTIRELQEVSREFKSTLEREIGMDEISKQNLYTAIKSSPAQSPSQSSPEKEAQDDINGSPGPAKAYSSEELLKITKEQLSGSMAKQQQQTPSPEEIKPQGENATTVTIPSRPENEI